MNQWLYTFELEPSLRYQIEPALAIVTETGSSRGNEAFLTLLEGLGEQASEGCSFWLSEHSRTDAEKL